MARLRHLAQRRRLLGARGNNLGRDFTVVRDFDSQAADHARREVVQRASQPDQEIGRQCIEEWNEQQDHEVLARQMDRERPSRRGQVAARTATNAMIAVILAACLECIDMICDVIFINAPCSPIRHPLRN
jgi:hypothetical protein